MGYVIGCHAPANHGKSTTIKLLCSELESMDNYFFEILYQEGDVKSDGDILRAYKRYGTIVFVISGGDYEKIVTEGYDKLQYACGGLNCDLLICATTQNEYRQTERIREIETSIENIAKKNGHWLEWLDLEEHYDNDENKIAVLRTSFSEASKSIIRNKH